MNDDSLKAMFEQLSATDSRLILNTPAGGTEKYMGC